MKWVRNIIFGGAILDNLCLRILFVITYVLNLLLTFLLDK